LVGGYGEQRLGEGGYQRYTVPKLSAASAALFEELLRSRLLPFISRELPAVEDMIWSWSSDSYLPYTPPIQTRTADSSLAKLPYPSHLAISQPLNLC
jgi:hypothetical protein